MQFHGESVFHAFQLVFYNYFLKEENEETQVVEGHLSKAELFALPLTVFSKGENLLNSTILRIMKYSSLSIVFSGAF